MNTELRIGDAEREAAVSALGEHFAAGRIDKDEFDERAAQAWAARTSGALVPLFADLPTPHPTDAGSPPTYGSPPAYGTPRPHRPNRPGVWRSGALRTAVLLGLVALAVAGHVLWFLAAIMAWVWCAGTTHAGWRRSRHHAWHHRRGWGHPVRR